MEHDAPLHPAIRPLTDLNALGALQDPILLVAFAGGWGATAGAALAYLAEQWEATPLAEIDPEDFFDFTATRPTVRLEDGERVIDWPQNRVYLARPAGAERDLVILVGVEPALRWRTFAEAVASLTTTLGIADSLVVSSFPGGVPHTRETPLRFFGAHEEFAARLGVTQWVPDYEGPTSFGGFLGVDQRARGLRASSLSAIAPFYIQVEPRPHALHALIRAIDRLFGTRTDLGAVQEQVDAANAQALDALTRSERYREVLAALEVQYDAAETAPAGEDAPLDSAEIVGDVEAFFRGPHDVNGPGTGSRRGG